MHYDSSLIDRRQSITDAFIFLEFLLYETVLDLYFHEQNNYQISSSLLRGKNKWLIFFFFLGTLRILSLILALCMCASGCHIMWNTDLFNVMVHQNLILRNNSLRYEAWEKVPVHANLRLYLYNYTNIKEYENGEDSKLKLQEVGPYTYV